SADQLVVCSGFLQGFDLLNRALRTRGAKSLALEDPFVPYPREVVAANGLVLQALPVDEHGAQVAHLTDLAPDAVMLTPAHQCLLGMTLHSTRRADVLAW